MWKYQILLCCATMFAAAYAGYTITASAPLAHYHYPAPRRQLTIPTAVHGSSGGGGGGGGGVQQYQQRANNYASYSQQQQQYQQQQQQQQQQYRPQQRQQSPQVSYSAPSYYQQQQSQQQQQQQQQYQQQRAPAATAIAQQFAAPALDNVAFTTALTNQGYVAGGSASAGRALPSAAGAGIGGNSIVVDSPEASLNLKLPLPINVVPIKVAALPLQAGASFDAIPHRINSYGTTYPQRKR